MRNGADGEMRISVSPIMLIMAVYFVAMGMAYDFVCSLAAALLHECAHAKVAKRLGYELNVIKLMPYGAALCGLPELPTKHEIAIAIAGPLFNLFVAVLFAALWWLAPSTYMFTQAFCFGNLYIGLFNLLPVYPLDGGRVMLACLSRRMKRARACKIMQAVSIAIGILTIGLFVLSAVYALNISLLSVGLFMLVSAFIPDRSAFYRAVFAVDSRAARLKSPMEVRRIAVSGSATLADVCGALDPDRYGEFVVIGEDMRVKGAFTESQLVDAAKKYGYDKKAEDIIGK